MKKLVLSLLVVTLISASCENAKEQKSNTVSDNNTIGSYTKQSLPQDFSYKVIKDESNERLEKNQLTIEINKKLNLQQLATLAEQIYDSKPRQRRFYIFYLVPGMRIGAGAWAISHFDPELKIEILGSTMDQDSERDSLVIATGGELVGKWHEEQYTAANYVIFKKNGRVFLKTVFGKGSINDDELISKKVRNGIRYDYKENPHGEYFVVNQDGQLEFYNREGKNFTTAIKIN